MVASRLRALCFAGLAATSAIVAHGGLFALANPAWGIPALAGAGIATAVLLAGWRLVAARGEHPAGASLPALIVAMVVAQGGAHAALLAAGVSAHGGAGGSLALHLALAVLAAWLVHRIDLRTAELAARALAAPPRERAPLLPRPHDAAPPSGALLSAVRGRGPPQTA